MARPALHPSLFDRGYWRERLARLDRCPALLRPLPRAVASGADHRATELWLRALDGGPLRALLLEPAPGPARAGLTAVLRERDRPACYPGPSAGADQGSEWPDLEVLARRAAEGRAVLVLVVEPGRRLEDRVLDLVRTIEAARANLRPASAREPALVDGPVAIEGDDDAAEIGRVVLAMRGSDAPRD